MKLGRNYVLTIQSPQGKQIIIKPPYTLKFEVDRNTFASANKTDMTIINLGSSIRGSLYKDRYNTTEFWFISLQAGYGNNLYELFKGNLYEAYSYKEKENWFTVLSGFDGIYDMQNSDANFSLAGGTSKSDAINMLANTMPNTQLGAAGALTQGSSPRGQVFVGSTWSLLKSQVYGHCFIDNATLNILGDNEVAGTEVLNCDTSVMFTTPRRRETFLDISIIFAPEARLATYAKVTSLYPIFNGQYAIVGLHHSVEISESECGEAVTTLNLNAGAKAFVPVGTL